MLYRCITNTRALARAHTLCPLGLFLLSKKIKAGLSIWLRKDAVLLCITHTKRAQTHRHLVYLIVECLTHHHTWISCSPFSSLSFSLSLCSSLSVSLSNTHAHTETTKNKSEASEEKTKASTICLAI